MQFIKQLLASVLCALMVINTGPTLRADPPAQIPFNAAWALQYTYTIWSPYNEAWQTVPYYDYSENWTTVTDQSGSVGGPSYQITRRTVDDKREYYDHNYTGKQLKKLSFTNIQWNWATSVQLQPGFTSFQVTNRTADGSTVSSSGGAESYPGAFIPVPPGLSQANVAQGYSANGYPAGTMIYKQNKGQQYVRVAGTNGLLYRLTVKLSTGTDAVTGFHYAPHFYWIHTVSVANVQGITSGAFNDTTQEVTMTVQPNVWYDVTPSYKTNPPLYYDFIYQIAVTSVTQL